MPKLPYLSPGAVTRVTTDQFLGYHRAARIADGEMYDTRNLSTESFPMLSTRRRRGFWKSLSAPGGLIEKDALCYVEGGTLYVNDRPTPVTGLTEGDKQLVGMGAYIVIFPDKRYYNTEDETDFGALEADWSVTGTIRYAPCDVDGNVYALQSVSALEPEEPGNGDYWLDTAQGTLQQFSAATGLWTAVETVYTKVSFPTQGQLTALFRRGDGVTVTGLSDEALCGTKLLYALGGEAETEEDYIVLVGLIGAERSEDGTVRLERRLPTLDFVCESQNRLWGCYYGLDGDKTVNEIYCSALGDFKNWRQYQGLATDSWAASVGSDGPWTGAVNYLGHPIFFKENRIHSVTVSALGAHRVDETVCRGVQKGSHRSLAVVGETLYYKSRTDVCAWQGGFPVSVSAALGEGRYEQAAAGAFGSRYYLSMRDESGAWSLFTYDIARGLWLREDELEVKYFARVDDSLWCVDGEGRLLDLRGEQGEREHAVDWAMESGIQYYEQPNRKYLSRFQIQLMMEAGASAEIYLEYDGTGVWQHQGHIALPRAGTVTVPVRPRRCTHMRMRLTGCGDVKVFSITRVLEVGSDV